MEYSSFSLHAGTFCPAHNRKKLERLCRYISRPSLSEQRLSLNAQGQVVYKLKTPYRNGTTHIVLSPLEFLSRLTSIIPRPRIHLIRFHGVFAPHCKYRSLIVPQPVPTDKTSHKEQEKEKKKEKKSYSMPWAKMLKRVFNIDIQICSKCGGQIKIISAIHNRQVIKRILNSSWRKFKNSGISPFQRTSGRRREFCHYLSLISITLSAKPYELCRVSVCLKGRKSSFFLKTDLDCHDFKGLLS